MHMRVCRESMLLMTAQNVKRCLRDDVLAGIERDTLLSQSLVGYLAAVRCSGGLRIADGDLEFEPY